MADFITSGHFNELKSRIAAELSRRGLPNTSNKYSTTPQTDKKIETEHYNNYRIRPN